MVRYPVAFRPAAAGDRDPRRLDDAPDADQSTADRGTENQMNLIADIVFVVKGFVAELLIAATIYRLVQRLDEE